MPTIAKERVKLEGAEGLVAWRSLMAPFFDMEVADQEAFAVESVGYHLGRMMCSTCRITPVHYVRSEARVSASDVDHVFVQLGREGHGDLNVDGRRIEVECGDVLILDLSRPFCVNDSDAVFFTCVLPRSLLQEAIGCDDSLHGVVLRGGSPGGALLADFLASLEERLETLETTQAPYVVEAFLSLLASALAIMPDADTSPAQVEVTSKEARIRLYIRRNLLSPDLTPDLLAERFGVSRSRLYRMFEGDGGVMAFIRGARLRRCFACIVDPCHRGKSVKVIAEEHGFSSAPHFNRAFHRAFGLSPSQARRAGVALTQRDDGSPVATMWGRLLDLD